MPETLYALGKADALDNNIAGAETNWLAVLSIEKESDLAAQTHFALAGLYRKQGKTQQANQEMQEFEKLKPPNPSQPATPAQQ
jgi:outer membrane protein assembly factor BamD (BamD/ComL family)